MADRALVLAARPPLDARLLEALEAVVAPGAGHPAYESVWRRTGLAEACERGPSADRYALSPRSTRGATRA